MSNDGLRKIYTTTESQSYLVLGVKRMLERMFGTANPEKIRYTIKENVELKTLELTFVKIK